ncbi:MAG: 3-hydroxybutyryl-CoA dehydrogenase [Pseudomonadales bacterium]|nr:3-hydroxybutyryl-CoA dehydrogenase [Halioglobus sp.]MCP5193802.1 3-hydroxybutyryl-CoA dehydrogenase [Pseudomonadales bacterium]
MSDDSRASRIAVVGAGRMGRGISLSFAFSGYSVQLCDSEEREAKAFAALAASVAQELDTELGFLQHLQLLSSEQAQKIAARITVVARPLAAEPLAGADFVFEAVAEVLEIKQSTYEWLNTVVSGKAVIGSTTSTMLVNSLARFVDNSSHFLNTHWLNPALLMPLVEMSPGDKTSDEAIASMKALLVSIGKQPVICAASPGFIVPRIQALAMTEAARCVEEGVASAEDVDKAIRIGFGVRYAVLGLLEFIDWGGGDIVYYATKYLAANLDDKRFSVPGIIEKNMRENHNGMRDGQGFYDYRERDVDAYRQQRMGDFVKLLQHLSLLPEAK